MIVSPGMGNKLNNADNNFEGFEQGVSLGALWLELFVCLGRISPSFHKICLLLVTVYELLVRPPKAGEGLDSFYFSD